MPWAVSLWHNRAGVATCCDHLSSSVTWSDRSDGRNNTRSRGGGQLYSLARSGNTRLWLNLTIRNIDMWVAVSGSQLLSVVFLSHFHLPSLSSVVLSKTSDSARNVYIDISWYGNGNNHQQLSSCKNPRLWLSVCCDYQSFLVGGSFLKR